MQSAAKTVEQYLAELPEPRRAVIRAVRDIVNRHLPRGYREEMAFGMIGWGIPLERYPHTYNGQPLSYVALAAQKRHNALYLMAVYSNSLQERWLRSAYAERGLKLDMGKCCLRFPDGAPPPEDLIGPLIASMSVEDYIEMYEAVRGAPRQKPAAKTKAGAKPAAKASGAGAAKAKAASKSTARETSASVTVASKTAALMAAAEESAARKAAASKAAASKPSAATAKKVKPPAKAASKAAAKPAAKGAAKAPRARR